MESSVFQRPSGFIPIAMSMAALLVIAVHVTVHGVAPQADEGSAAHLWQLLMAGQLPVIAYFAVRALPSDPRRALVMLALQLAAAVAAAFPVWWFQW